MSSESLSMSDSANTAAGTDADALRLWNPRAAACWSILFSPAFGAYLNMLNWESLGEAGKAAESRTWFRMFCVLLALNLIIGAFAVSHGLKNPVPNFLGLALTTVWYLRSGRAQEKYVEEAHRDNYSRKGWARPVVVAIAAALAYFVLAVVISALFMF